jgi:putative DNA methylase
VIPKDCKRLAEVDFPIAEVSRHAAKEKSIRHGHPSTLHLWWARRPLASSRAVLLGLLWPDPCDPLCPMEFKDQARKLLRQVAGCNPGTTDEDLRTALLKFIADFANWDLASNRTYLDVSRALVKAAHGEEPPLVVDPFAGGGSIPLEALRVGCEAFASDLNPVACLILKVMLEDIPRSGPKLAEELRHVGAEIKRQAEKELADLYPKDPDGATPIAYLWARTVRCESPNCGAEIPLVRSLWLCKKTNRRRALRHLVARSAGNLPRVEFEIFEPKKEEEVSPGTVIRAKATCPACGAVLPPDRVRAQLFAQRGGGDVVFDSKGHRTGGARMLAVVTLNKNSPGREYRLPSSQDLHVVLKAHKALDKMSSVHLPNGESVVPAEAVVQQRVAKNSPFRFHLYGCNTFGSLCTARQKVALLTLARQIREVGIDGATRELLALVLDRVASRSSSLSTWRYQADQEKVEHMFVRQALSIEWDFAESVPISASTGSFQDGLDVVTLCVESLARSFDVAGQAMQADAARSPLPDHVAAVWFTDPPYYDAVPYSDLSDYFYVWLKRALPGHLLLTDKDDPSNALTPKRREARMDEAREVDGVPKNGAFFEAAIARATKVADCCRTMVLGALYSHTRLLKAGRPSSRGSLGAAGP